MFMEERQSQIADKINTNGNISITSITEEFGISDESARRDLRMLEKKGLCKRTHGGAIRLEQVSVRPSLDRKYDAMPIYDNYREIAREAVKLIRKNDIVYLTGGSLGYIMLSYLPRDFHYTVVFNTVDFGTELRNFENIDVYAVGGKMRRSGSVVDSFATAFVSQLHFDLCFITGGGLTTEFGLSNGTDETASFQRAVLKNSRKKCLLLPGAKVGVDSFVKVCDVELFNQIITDWDCVDEFVSDMQERNIEITVVKEPK